MVEGYQDFGGPLAGWAGLLVQWLEINAVSSERSVRTVRALAGFSRWISDRGLIGNAGASPR